MSNQLDNDHWLNMFSEPGPVLGARNTDTSRNGLRLPTEWPGEKTPRVSCRKKRNKKEYIFVTEIWTSNAKETQRKEQLGESQVNAKWE